MEVDEAGRRQREEAAAFSEMQAAMEAERDEQRKREEMEAEKAIDIVVAMEGRAIPVDHRISMNDQPDRLQLLRRKRKIGERRKMARNADVLRADARDTDRMLGALVGQTDRPVSGGL